jgi:hypothetical protein
MNKAMASSSKDQEWAILTVQNPKMAYLKLLQRNFNMYIIAPLMCFFTILHIVLLSSLKKLLFQDEWGKVFSWGNNNCGQCGHNEDVTVQAQPK